MGLFGLVLALEIARQIEYVDAKAKLDARRVVRGARDQERLSRMRWQELHHAERSFPCGIAMVPETEGALLPRPAARQAPVPPPPSAGRPVAAGEQSTPPMPVEPALAEAPPLMRPAEVTAAVLPHDLAFLLEDGIGDVEEAGRLPRTAISGIDVVDVRDVHVPEPVRETIEPSQIVFLVLRWKNEGVDDEDRFAFRSPWLAWRAGRKLLEARRG
jgi:hypothetical protein